MSEGVKLEHRLKLNKYKHTERFALIIIIAEVDRKDITNTPSIMPCIFEVSSFIIYC